MVPSISTSLNMSNPPYQLYTRIYTIVQQIPPGQVASYGDIAQIVGGGCDARTVGYALNDIPKRGGEEIPWQRVVNKAGAISTRGLLQRQLLTAEGVVFAANDRIDLRRFRWAGPDITWAAEHGYQPLLPLPQEPEEPDSPEQLSLF